MRPPFMPRDDDYSGLVAFFLALAAVAIGLLFLAHAAFAQEPNASTKENRCNSIANVISAIQSLPPEIRNQVHVRALNADETTRWRNAYNALPPQSDTRMDAIAFIRRDGNAFVVLLVEVDGCIVNAVRVGLDVHQTLLRDSGLTLGRVM